ncbi:hypothetical protein C7T94_09155 [Pedobacter yulinensis]|uniref:Uncharacterized protein n=1 Tax=Pedobacter yulinensis TaxID=2126353 RepID=A0A2T3HK50_9SPHI|nr:hypothetical protein [Pedobacter yulinensis]PST82800.1 hypothetical protein C7T94_09155 [Pedobacter yulinensis]
METQHIPEQGAGGGAESASKLSWPDPLNGPGPGEEYDSRSPEEGETPDSEEPEREPESGDKLEGSEPETDKPEQDFDVDESTGGSAL